MSREKLFTHTFLGRLKDQEVSQLVNSFMGRDDIPQSFILPINESAEGNPFFSEELMYALQERNIITINRDDCKLSTSVMDLVGLDFPDTSQDVIRSRIDRLTPQEQLTIKVASVIGRSFSYRLLHDIHPVESDKVHLESNLETLAQNAFIRKVASEPELEFSFKHNIIHEVAYNLMLSNQRRELHRSIANWYERNYSADLAQVYPLLAHHWNQTENTDKAIEFLYQAGKQALRNFANREAVTFLTGALFRADSQEAVYG